MGPGPSEIHPRVLAALGAGTVGHLDPYYLELMNGLQEMLRQVLRTKNAMTFAISATGSAGMEAAVVNLIEPGDSMVVCINGVFGQRMSDVAARNRGLSPLARITGYATGGTEPKWVMYAPVVAIEKLAKATGRRAEAYDLVELNEAFSSAACAVTKESRLDPARTNVNGGAVALGHPIGASGARILTTLLHAMHQRDVKHGFAALCLGGGNAVALSVER